MKKPAPGGGGGGGDGDGDDLSDNDDAGDDGDDGNGVVRRYQARGATSRPSKKVLARFEFDPFAAILMAEEQTGFADQDKQRIHDHMTDPDIELRTKAEKDFEELGQTFGPDPVDMNRMHKEYYERGADHHLLLQTCSVCGKKDFQDKLHCNIYPIDANFKHSPLRLTPAEARKYNSTPSRVYGLLDLRRVLLSAVQSFPCM